MDNVMNLGMQQGWENGTGHETGSLLDDLENVDGRRFHTYEGGRNRNGNCFRSYRPRVVGGCPLPILLLFVGDGELPVAMHTNADVTKGVVHRGVGRMHTSMFDSANCTIN